MKKLHEYYGKWNGIIEKAHADLSKMGIDDAVIDEVALLFQSHHDATQFIRDAVQEEETILFNYAEDTVETYPFATQYFVGYYFLTTPYGYRVEAMVPGAGMSPLHDAMKPGYRRDNEPNTAPTVHFSFKVPDLVHYKRVCDMLRAYGWHEAQGCASKYGVFSYWSPDPKVAQEDMTFPRGVYLKPRVNTRDSDTISEAALEYLESKA